MQPAASWRPMHASDLPAVMRIAGQVHPGYPEDLAIFTERQQLYPQGCWVRQQASHICGYLVSHPWQLGMPPALNSMLHALPSQVTTYYLHDIALLPSSRGSNAAGDILAQLYAQAAHERLDNLSLIAVNRSFRFWQRQQFQAANHLVPAAKLQSYDSAASYMVRALA
ncbi:GNAT family N-acetyltransferase [Methylobacillus flagellatus]|nr:GNAT family N-acetyltransferase [Methylobacillus flagellatus]